MGNRALVVVSLELEAAYNGALVIHRVSAVLNRESAKTSIAKLGLVWIIARKQVIDALRAQG